MRGFFRHNRGFTVSLKFLLLGLPALLSACVAVYRNHGYVPTDDELANIFVGTDTRSSVEDVIGQPSSTGLLSDGGWYYLATRVRHYTYNQPKVVERQLVAISFDQNDVVTNIERYGLEDGRVVVLSRRVTSPAVKPPTFLQQMIGNIGNINPSDFFNN